MSTACPKCATPKPDDATACQNCGVIFAKLASARVADVSLYAPNKPRFGAFHAFILAVVLCVAGTASWHFIKKTAAGKAAVAQAAHAKQNDALTDRKRAEAQRSEANKALNNLTSILRKWDDAAKLADITSRNALATPVASLQAIRREAQDLIVPPCADETKRLAVQAMDSSINGFMLFMQSADAKYEAGKLINESATLLQKSNDASDACNRPA